MHPIVFSIGDVQEFLLRVVRKRNIPDGPRAQSLLLDESFLDERAIWFENLDAVVHAIADIQQAVVREHGAVYRIAKLLRGRAVRIVGAEVRVVRLVGGGAPMP